MQLEIHSVHFDADVKLTDLIQGKTSEVRTIPRPDNIRRGILEIGK